MLGAIYLITCVVALRKAGPSISLLYVIQGSYAVLGLFILDSSFEVFMRYQVLSYLFFLFGFMLSGGLGYSRVRLPEIGRRSHTYAFLAVMIMLIVISVYHYSVVGIPFFSENIDVTRFTSDSGMFGIPSRLAIYGPMLTLMILCSLYNASLVNIRQFFFFLIPIVILLGMQGNKSSLIQVLAGMLIVYGFLKRRNILRNGAIAFVSIAVLYVFVVFSKLQSLSDQSALQYLMARVTTILFTPGLELYESDIHFELLLNSPILNDILLPASRLISGNIESLNIQLSREIYGVMSGFTVPVTPGFFSYHSYIFGPIISLLICFLLGVFVSKLVKGIAAAGILKFSVICYIQYWLYIGFTSGNVYYLVMNTLMPLLIICIFYKFIRSLFQTYVYSNKEPFYRKYLIS